jgi:hypothetical protein
VQRILLNCSRAALLFLSAQKGNEIVSNLAGIQEDDFALQRP